MDAAFDVIRNVINTNVPDEWDEARKVIQKEYAETLVLDYDTAYKTRSGLKSGEYLTSVIGCIVNELQLAMTYGTYHNGFNLATYRENVSPLFYGDDGIISCSDVAFSKINYYTIKQYLESIGHIITPGNKDGIEAEEVKFENLVFLKRNFVYYNNIVLAPLDKRSIESPFVYTQIPDTDTTIWFNLVSQQLDEAALHGQQYYEEFVSKLKKCKDPSILAVISPLLSVPYNIHLQNYVTEKYAYN